MNKFLLNRKNKFIKYKFFINLFLTYLFFTISRSYAKNPEFLIYASHNPPYVIKINNNKYKGISIEIIQELFKASNIKYKIISTDDQWKRAIIPEQKNTVLLLFRTPERENKYKWIAPLFEDKLYIFYNNKKISKLEPLKNYQTIGTLAGGAAESILKSLGYEEKTYLCKNDIQCIELLKEKKIDLWVVLGIKSNHYVKNGNLKNFIIKGPSISSEKLWLVASPETSEDDILVLKKSVKKFFDTKKYKEIQKKYETIE